MTFSRSAPLGDRPYRGATLKADHPRAIDRYIDFFGDGTATGAEALETRTLSSESNRTESVHSYDFLERRSITRAEPGSET